jgi:hypothetical protein
MTVDEALAFVATHPHVFLLTRRADGFPTAYAMSARVDRRSILFTTYRASAKVGHLLREGTATVVAADEDGGTRVVELSGPVRVADSERWLAPPESPAVPHRGMAGVPDDVAATVRDRHESGKRIVLEVVPESARASRALP